AQISGPVPSPSINGMTGRFGTFILPFSTVIFSPCAIKKYLLLSLSSLVYHIVKIHSVERFSPLNLPFLLAVLDRHVFLCFWSDIFSARTNQTIVIILFEYMRQPSGDTACCKDWCKQVVVNAQTVVYRC